MCRFGCYVMCVCVCSSLAFVVTAIYGRRNFVVLKKHGIKLYESVLQHLMAQFCRTEKYILYYVIRLFVGRLALEKAGLGKICSKYRNYLCSLAPFVFDFLLNWLVFLGAADFMAREELLFSVFFVKHIAYINNL